MFVRLFRQFFSASLKAKKSDHLKILLSNAESLITRGYIRQALKEYLEVLSIDNTNVIALNGVAVCYSDLGDISQAQKYFDIAYALDDTYLPAIVNSAQMDVNRDQTKSALVSLKKAKIVDPYFPHTDAVYASVCFKLGDPTEARQVQLRAWLANFDNLRLANGFLFNAAYCDLPERMFAAEHRFWAETLINKFPQLKIKKINNYPVGKIKIGYWSPDFRNHSVRYFFKPLLLNHNKQIFEVYLYHDSFSQDQHTEQFKSAADFFVNVYELTDEELVKKIVSDELDVLVELAGHTSANRVNLLQNKLAPVQITGIGSPLTTGLSSIDYKILDVHSHTHEDSSFYSENPLLLPESFWCFDPMEDIPLAQNPPVIYSERITFGCVGNISKINDRILSLWKIILKRLPNSRLIIRSIGFSDSSVITAFKEKLKKNALPLQKIDIRLPEAGINFFTSYDEIDIILDTYPFNGGTTTCFAVYMGVPVVSLAGNSLLSRMGLSILNNLNASHLIARTDEEYIHKAIELSQNVNYLKEFKKSARSLMQKTALGNGKLFAFQFESIIQDLLSKTEYPIQRKCSNLDILPLTELVKRAYTTLKFNQHDACRRIIDLCLRYYPTAGDAHIAYANMQAIISADYLSQIQYLYSKIHLFSESDQLSALLTMIRWSLLVNKTELGMEFLQKASTLKIEDRIDISYFKIYTALLMSNSNSVCSYQIERLHNKSKTIHVIVVGDSETLFDKIKDNFLLNVHIPKECQVRFTHTSVKNRAKVYADIANQEECDIMMLMHDNVSIFESKFLYFILSDLEKVDIVGFAGAKKWEQLDWMLGDIYARFGVYGSYSLEIEGGYDYVSIGVLGEYATETDIKVLNGALIIANKNVFKNKNFCPILNDSGTLMEQYWTYSCASNDVKMMVDLRLGICLNKNTTLSLTSHVTEGREYVADQLQLEMSSFYNEDSNYIVVPIQSVNQISFVNKKIFI
ncbi:MAG: hypothetical protein RLZZ612_1622 [Pseudomonadota bacterium]|jgi:predicted O-linked N-acetylglucosamine transferase (SPINDLY family)